VTGLSHDVIVIGGGLMGSAAAWRLARDGRSVLVLDRYLPGHQLGSSHGSSRIIRLAYDTDDYVALARAAYALWRELEAEAGETLMVPAGGLDIGMPDAEEVDEIRAAYQRTGVEHAYMGADEIMARWPQFSLPEGMRGLYQADYSLLAADACVATLQERAAAHGATFRWEEPATGIAALPGGGVEVTTALGVHRGAKAILATGSWIAPMLRDLGLDLPLYVRKEFVCYVAARHQERFEPGRFPLVIHRFPGNRSLGSFFPSFGHTGVKTLIDRLGAVLDPESEDREVDPVALENVRQYACRMIPDAGQHALPDR